VQKSDLYLALVPAGAHLAVWGFTFARNRSKNSYYQLTYLHNPHARRSIMCSQVHIPGNHTYHHRLTKHLQQNLLTPTNAPFTEESKVFTPLLRHLDARIASVLHEMVPTRQLRDKTKR